jgi:CRP-like cAMP-binding protein
VSENLSEMRPEVRPKAPPAIADLGFAGLGGNRLLAARPSADMELLAPHLRKVEFDPGCVLQEPGEPIARAYFIEGGLVSLLALLPDGRAIDTSAIGREGAIGLMTGMGAQKS